MRARDDFAQHTRDALHHLYDSVYLQTHPLAALLNLEPGGGSSVSVGAALRQRLLQTIAALRPGPETATGSAAWRRYQILTMRYVEDLDIPVVQDRLSISSGTYFREQQRGLDAVVSLLREFADAESSVREPEAHDSGRLMLLKLPTRPLEVQTGSDSSHAPRSRLLLPLTSFIGRDQERDAVQRLVSSVRLLTLTGPPGAGKTRLALSVAEDLRDDFPDGVFFVPLAHIRDVGLVLSSIAQALGVREMPGEPILESLAQALRDKTALLVLDNFEQVLPAAPRMAELLSLSPGLKLIITSRAVLHVRGEHDFAVPPLALPDSGDLPELDRLGDYAAVQLFVERAREVKPDFTVTPETAPALVRICRRLDGLPLAIELAAVRVRLLPLPAMLARLERRLPLLTGGAQDLPERQQTLRAAIDWSYDLLDPAAQTLFRRLAVFEGGATLEAIERVTAADLTGPPQLDVLESLTTLVEQSLIQLLDVSDDPEQGPRVVMLESLGEYAEEKMRSSGEEAGLRQSHADYYLRVAEQLAFQAAESGEADRIRQLERLATEHGNFRAALRWLVDRRAVGESLSLAAALGEFWELRNYLTEGRRWFQAVVAIPGSDADASALAKALYWAGSLSIAQGDFPDGHALMAKSVALARKVDDRRLLARALGDLGRVVSKRRDTTARPILEESLALFRGLGGQGGVAGRLLDLSFIATCEGLADRSRALLTETLDICTRLGNRASLASGRHLLGLLEMTLSKVENSETHFESCLAAYRDLALKQGIAGALNRLSELAVHRGDAERAAKLLDESYALAQELRDKDTLAWTLKDLGRLARLRGDSAGSESFFRASLTYRRDQGHAWGMAVGILELAEEASSRGSHGRAVRLFAAGQSMYRSSGALPCTGDLSGYDVAGIEARLTTLRSQLDPAMFDAALTSGATMDSAAAIAEALQVS